MQYKAVFSLWSAVWIDEGFSHRSTDNICRYFDFKGETRDAVRKAKKMRQKNETLTGLYIVSAPEKLEEVKVK